jgi:predicted transcriptional regulator of viral defense system
MNRTNASAHGISEKNRKMVTNLHRGTSGPFTPSEAAGLLNMDIDRSRRFLAYLADNGWLTRIRRGLYSTISLDVVEPSSWKEDPWIIASKVFTPFYIGGWSACENWGLTEQIFKDTVVITSHMVRRRHMEIQRTPFIVKTVKSDKLFGTEAVWRGRTRVPVSDPSRTIVDILDDPGIGGGIRHVRDILEAYLSHSKRNDSLLMEYARKLGNKTVFKRLGYLLESLSLKDTNLVEECHKTISSGISLLDPTAARKGRIIRKWNLQINVTLGPDSRSIS